MNTAKKVLLLKLILVMDVDKNTYIKIARLKIKRIIIVEIRDISSHFVENNPEKIRNLKLTLQKQKTHFER